MVRICMMLLGIVLLWPCGVRAGDGGKTLDEVWMTSGGARLHYDALTRPRQIYMNGARWEDPALVHRMGPLYDAEKKSPVRRRGSRNTRKAPAQPVSAVSMPAAVAPSVGKQGAETAPRVAGTPTGPTPSGPAFTGTTLTPPTPRH